MSVTKKPTPPKSVDEFIQSAQATVLNAMPAKTASVQPVQLRVPEDLLTQIDQAVNKRRPAPSRHQWILEAIYDKLGRDPNN